MSINEGKDLIEKDLVQIKKQKRITCGLMLFLVCAWGLDYVFAKNALTSMEPLTLLFCKYSCGFIVVMTIKFFIDRKSIVSKKDIPVFVLCSILGEILYFWCEYSAMDYIPISVITIILAFVPAVSIIIELIAFKRKPSIKTVMGVLFCIFGVGLVIGMDMDALFEGRIWGYVLAFAAVFSWNAYNFVTASLHDRYSSVNLTKNQLMCTIIIIAPYALTHLPAAAEVTPSIIGGVLYLGIFSAGLGFLIQVRSLHILGPTTTALFSNFLPITATFFGWLFLKESISIIQIVGGIIVISAGYIVIKEKGKTEGSSHESEQLPDATEAERYL